MFFQSILTILKTILFGWIVALVHLLRALFAGKPDGRSERDRRAARAHCVPIDEPAFVRPDPLLYSQQHLMALGLAVTWDNPDIVLFRNGAPVPSHELEPGTTYDVQSRIWNDSFDAPAINVAVHLSYLDFGIGTTPIPVGSTTIDVGVKGGPKHPAFATVPWRTPDQPGHYCLRVILDPIDDSDTTNNVGQENTDVGVARSPALFRFTLRNATRRPHRYHFETNAYELGRRPPCDDEKSRREPLGRHRRADHPVPEGFQVDIEPAMPTLAPGQDVPINVSITPPAGFVGIQRVNVDAFDEQGPAGGVTLSVVGEG